MTPKTKELADVILKEMKHAAKLELTCLKEILDAAMPDIIKMSEEEKNHSHDAVADRMVQAFEAMIRKQLEALDDIDLDELASRVTDSVDIVKSGTRH